MFLKLKFHPAKDTQIIPTTWNRKLMQTIMIRFITIPQTATLVAQCAE